MCFLYHFLPYFVARYNLSLSAIKRRHPIGCLFCRGGERAPRELCPTKWGESSVSPLKDRQARLPGAGRANFRATREYLSQCEIVCAPNRVPFLSWRRERFKRTLPHKVGREFGFAARRSASSLARRRACEFSRNARIPLSTQNRVRTRKGAFFVIFNSHGRDAHLRLCYSATALLTRTPVPNEKQNGAPCGAPFF